MFYSLSTFTYLITLIFIISLVYLYLIQKIREKGIIFKFFLGILLIVYSFYTGFFIGVMVFSPEGGLKISIIFGNILSFSIILQRGTVFLIEYFKFKNVLSHYFKKEKVLISYNNYIAMKKLAENYVKMGEYEKAKKILKETLENIKEESIKMNLNMEIDNLEAFLRSIKSEEKKVCKFCKNEIFKDSIICNFCEKVQYPISPYIFFKELFKINPRIFIVIPLFFFFISLTIKFSLAFSYIFLFLALYFLIYNPFGDLKVPSKEEFD